MRVCSAVLLVILLVFSIGVSGSAFNDRVIDFVLKLARTRAARSGKVRELGMPGNISVSVVVIDEIRMGNLLNLYRIVNNSHLGLSDEGFGLRTGLEIRNVSMKGRYTFNQWPLSFGGEIETNIGRVLLAADITLDKFNFQRIHLNTFKCLDVVDVELRKMTNAYDIVRRAINSTLNSWLGKRYLKSSIETTAKEFIQAELASRRRSV